MITKNFSNLSDLDFTVLCYSLNNFKLFIYNCLSDSVLIETALITTICILCMNTADLLNPKGNMDQDLDSRPKVAQKKDEPDRAHVNIGFVFQPATPHMDARYLLFDRNEHSCQRLAYLYPWPDYTLTMKYINGVLRPCLSLAGNRPAPRPLANNDLSAGLWFNKPVLIPATANYTVTSGNPPRPLTHNADNTKVAILP